MSKQNDWYRSSDWDDDAQQIFNQKIARSRQPSSTCHYFKAKAELIRDDHPHDALELLFRALNECRWPEDDQDFRADHECRVHLQIGECYQQLKRVHAAEFHYRTAIAIRPFAIRRDHDFKAPEERLAALIIHDPRKDRREEAEALWEHFYQIKYSNREDEYPSFESMAVREYRDIHDEIYPHPEEAAVGVVSGYHFKPNMDALFQRNGESLAALDAYFRKDFDGRFHPRWHLDYTYLINHAVVEFGAFFGQVLVNELGGEWRVAKPMMKSRVIIGRRKIDPFLIGWKAVFYEIRFTDAFDEIAAAQKP